jgi:general secretion pathway protein K
MTRESDEGGYALVAAVTAVAAFAYIAFQVLAANMGAIAGVQGKAEQARLAAAADGGIYLAIHALASDDRAERWGIDGRPRHVSFEDMDLTIVVEDERGKAPLQGLNDAQARALFQGAGASVDKVDALVGELRDWQAQDDTPGAAAAPYAPGSPARHGPMRTVGELTALPDMDAATYAQVAPVLTVFFEASGPFEPRNARPLAIAAMSRLGGEGQEQVEGQAAIAAEQADEEISPDDHLMGRPLTIRVTAKARDGAHTGRMAIAELTGDPDRPYWIRYVE